MAVQLTLIPYTNPQVGFCAGFHIRAFKYKIASREIISLVVNNHREIIKLKKVYQV